MSKFQKILEGNNVPSEKSDVLQKQLVQGFAARKRKIKETLEEIQEGVASIEAQMSNWIASFKNGIADSEDKALQIELKIEEYETNIGSENLTVDGYLDKLFAFSEMVASSNAIVETQKSLLPVIEREMGKKDPSSRKFNFNEELMPLHLLNQMRVKYENILTALTAKLVFIEQKEAQLLGESKQEATGNKK